jgi:hypothetical protein
MASPPPEYVRVQGWRPELLYFPDAPVGHVITPSLVRSISGFHNSLSRSYAYVVYGKSNARRLHGDDLDALDLNILVRDGSNGFQIVEEALDRLTREILAKMTGRQVTIGFVLFLLLYFSESVLKDWIAEAYKAREHTAEIAERLKLSEEETARIRLVTQALSANPNLKPMAVIADDGHAALLKGAATADRAVVLGTEVTKEEAQTVTAPREQVAEGRRIDGTFEVAEIDVDNPEGFMGTLRDPKTQQEFRVSINLGELPAEDRRALFDALESKAAVDALVNGWFVGGKLDSASIVRATKRAPPTPPGGGEPGTQSLPSIAQRKQP